MENFKEFQGRDLDAAIDEACAYFNAEREKLEVEIVQDAKSGIFGIVGARKAKVRARRAQLRQAVESILGRHGSTGEVRGDSRSEAANQAHRASQANQGNQEKKHTCKPRPQGQSAAPAVRPEPSVQHRRAEAAPALADQPEAAASAHGATPASAPAAPVAALQPPCAREEGQPRAEEKAAPGPEIPGPAEELDTAAEGLPPTPLEELDVERLKALSEDVVRQLVRPIVGEDVSIEVSVGNGRVQVQLDCAEDSGLLIGREGQTLASLRYLASRLVSRGMGAAVRIQLDAGEYRRRQDAKLREIALALAERVRQSGRSCSTRPLSSYHRRIVHVCLQEMPDVQTRSTGDGPLKRVVISRRRPERA